MTRMTVSRRNLLATGASALAGAVTLLRPARASASGAQNLTNEQIIRKWYAAWEKKDLGTFDMPRATTTSARAPSKRNAGTHRLISLNTLTWSGSTLAPTMLL